MQIENGFYSYPINCPACQESPNVSPDEELAKNCQTCHGLGEIMLQLTEEELAEIYKEFLNIAEDNIPGCPYMKGQIISSQTKTCPMTGARKISS